MGEATKRCMKCGEVKPLSEFYRHPEMKDGHLNKCKDCTKRDVAERRSNNPEAELQTRVKACKRKPTPKNAYRAVDAALRCGVLIRPTVCSGCGCSDSEHRIEAHHYDYSKPLDVIWLCTPCHERIDAERRLRNGSRSHSRSRPVVMKQDGEVICRFSSITEAAKAVQRSINSVRQALDGKSKQCAGFEWAYEEQ